jgi:class 3 adenylate cyclase
MTVSSATLTMLVTDAVTSTAFRHRQGDFSAHEQMALVESVVKGAAGDRGGRFVKNTGDGQLVVFESARSAVSTALEVQRSVHRLNAEDPERAIQMRAGIHTGEAILEDGDVHGTAVVAAFRINAKAGGEEVLVSEMVRGVLGGANEFAFIERGRFSLKGFRERWRLYQVPWRSADAEPEERECAIIFTDVQDSTRTVVELGDRHSQRQLRASHAMFRAAANASGAVHVRVMGDNGIAAFAKVDQAVSAAEALREAALVYSRANPDMPLRFGTGIHLGNVLWEADEVYGLTMFIAARVCGLVGPGEVLLTEEARAALPPGSHEFAEERRVTLRKIPGERLLFPLI